MYSEACVVTERKALSEIPGLRHGMANYGKAVTCLEYSLSHLSFQASSNKKL